MAGIIAQNAVGLISMFNSVIVRPEHPGAQIFPRFGNGTPFSTDEQKRLGEVSIQELMREYFKKSLARAHAAGIPDECIMLDPGIGFGLTKRENLQLIQSLGDIHDMGYMCFLGLSRKRFIVNILEETGCTIDMKSDAGLECVDYGSAFLTAIAAFSAVNVLRVHDIPKHLQAKAVGDAIRLAENSDDRNFAAYRT